MLENRDICEFMVGSHNETSVRYAVHRMQDLGLPPSYEGVVFAQLYGMRDHVTFSLVKKTCFYYECARSSVSLC